MPITPGVTLTATTKNFMGNAALQGYLRITLCGFGPALPSVPTVCMLANAGVPQLLGPASSFSQLLWGNDVISPAETFYEVAMLDANKNVIQAGVYQFPNATGTIDLSSAAQFIGPYGMSLPSLAPAPCSGAVPGSTYTAPGIPILVFLNGVMLPRGESSPTLSYTATAETITLNFATAALDRIDALCLL
jgi:hypothetical protein